MSASPVIYVIDDDDSSRGGLMALVESRGWRTRGFDSALDFLDQLDLQAPGCLVTDYMLAGMDGLELQTKLLERGSTLPLIVVTGHANVSVTVRFMQRGALTLLEKPVVPNELCEAIELGLARAAEFRAQRAQQDSISSRLATLSANELQVAAMVLKGVPNKRISQKMGTSMRTVDRRRRSILTKMRAGSVAELARIVEQAGGLPGNPAS